MNIQNLGKTRHVFRKGGWLLQGEELFMKFVLNFIYGINKWLKANANNGWVLQGMVFHEWTGTSFPGHGFQKPRSQLILMDVFYSQIFENGFFKNGYGKFGNWFGKYFFPKYLWGGYRKLDLLQGNIFQNWIPSNKD